MEKLQEYSDTIIKTLITSIVTAVIVGIVTRYTLINTLSDQMIKVEMRVKNLEDRYVERNEFEPFMDLCFENKSEVKKNREIIQRHEIAIELISK